MTLLIVEDKDSLRDVLRKTLEAEGFAVETAADGGEAIARLRARRFTTVLTDLRLPVADGMSVLEAALDSDPEVPVIVMTAFGTIEAAVDAMKAGARDFLAKPVDPDHLVLLVRRATEQRHLRQENLVLRDALEDRLGGPTIVGESAEIRAVAHECQRVAATNATALLLGDSGTGKELFARAIHHLSPRGKDAFVAINCAAIPETLLENELFGHEKGAYTGAGASKIGKFELAHGGTLFLDEIGDLSPAVQAKLLRVLQDRTFERVGGVQTIEVDVRIVAATNKDLRAEVAAMRFREDLFYRLSVFPIHIPPLSQRPGDVTLLARHFVERFGRQLGRPGLHLSEASLEALSAHHWPGNIRELQNTIERAMILADGPAIEPRDLALGGGQPERGSVQRVEDALDLSGTLQQAVERVTALVEGSKIREALAGCGGNKTKAAQALDVSYKTLLNKMRDLEIR